MMSDMRRIFNHSESSPKILEELFHNIFMAEFLDPSDEIWIVSPWVSNIQIFDNRGGAFTTLCPDWQGLSVKLGHVLIRLLSVQAKINVVANNDTHNDQFFFSLDQKSKDLGWMRTSDYFAVKRCIPRIFTRHGSLTGSMNITFSGVNINDEHLVYTISKEAMPRTI